MTNEKDTADKKLDSDFLEHGYQPKTSQLSTPPKQGSAIKQEKEVSPKDKK